MTRPDGQDLRALERQARHQGSGLADPAPGCGSDGSPHPLTGTWRLEQLWSAKGDQPIPLTAAILRGFGACLEVGERAEDGRFPLRNGVNLGCLSMDFRGHAVLVGRRPLLVFNFDQLSLSVAGRLLWQRSLPGGQETLSLVGSRRQPFFALIGCDRAEGWLAARGRGGGLALWGLNTETPLPAEQA
jgi:hypothetical protein